MWTDTPLRAPAFIVAMCLAAVAVAQEAPDSQPVAAPPNTVWIDDLDLGPWVQQVGAPRARRSYDDHPLTLNGVEYPGGVGSHACSEVGIELGGAARRFVAMVGVDDEMKTRGSVVFEVWVDGVKKFDSGVMRGGDLAKAAMVDLGGAGRLALIVTDAGDGIVSDHADWAGAVIEMLPDAKSPPRTVQLRIDDPPMPMASGTSPKPAIHGPRVVGTTPGRPFLFRVPATGEGPLEYSAKKLPKGLRIDARAGVIDGVAEKPGEYKFDVQVKGPRGKAKRKLRIVAGEHRLALTPPMGWNSWNVWGCAVDDAKIRAAADAMVAGGLAAHGFAYINIDDCWQGKRGADGAIQPNEKFPDMKALADYVHSRGLKLGIYSSPGAKTCAEFEGSFDHEEQDAATWAMWGVDYVKYDWCSYGEKAKDDSLEERQKPYRAMRAALDRCDRDIVFSLCQYGAGDVWTWGAEVGGNLWRTTGDISDNWFSLADIGFDQGKCSPYAGPGRWNDPDMLVVGKVGWGPNLHDTHLTKNEQITHITLWSLLAAPLLIGCDMTQMDAFTLDLLTNDEVLDVDQDPLGRAAVRKAREADTEVWARPLADGTVAVGLFNRGGQVAPVTAKWSDLGLKGSPPVRDLWQRRDLGKKKDSITLEVRAHGAAMLKIGKPKDID